MKKLSIILCCVLLLQLCGCVKKQDEAFQKPVNYYYCSTEITYGNPAGVISAESREGVQLNDSVEALLESYLQGPVSDKFHAPFPKEIALLSYNVTDNEGHLVFSPEFAELTGIDLSVCCSCILMTVHDFSGIDTIHFSVSGMLLDEKKELVLSIDDIILMDAA